MHRSSFGFRSASGVAKGQFTPQVAIAARRRFLSEGVVPGAEIPAPILRSWQRSAAHGLSMAGAPDFSILPRQLLREAQEHNEVLVRAARGEMEVLFQDAAMTGGIVILTDRSGVVLISLGTGELASEAGRLTLCPGAGWDERAAGTSAIGIALAERQPVSVHGGEHFFDLHGVLSCSAAPIFDPCGAITGVLDLTHASNVPQTHTLALVNRAVEQIEHRLFESEFRNHEQVHFHPDPYLIGSSHEGLLAFDGGRLVGANRRGLSLLGLDWPALGALRFNQLFAIKQGGRSDNPPSDGCVVQTKSGQTLFARLAPPRQVQGGFAPAGALHACLPKMGDEPHLRQFVDQILSGPLGPRLDVRRVKAGQLIYGEDGHGPAAQSLLVVRSGRLRCFASFEGKELTLFTLDAGDAMTLHAGSLFEVKKDGEIAVIGGDAFWELAQRDPSLALYAVPAISRMLQKSLQMIEDMVFRDVKYRLIRALCDAAARDGRKTGQELILDMAPSAEDFAMQIGATRQSVSTVIAGLIRNGLVRRLGATAMAISDLDRLQNELH